MQSEPEASSGGSAKAEAKETVAKATVAELEPDKLSPMEEFFQCVLGPLLLLFPAPILCIVLSFITCSPAVTTPTLSGAYAYILK
ncbi:hypothetical protein T492DRAFT_888559, partial [Pavlovales sp. CCMP2436]